MPDTSPIVERIWKFIDAIANAGGAVDEGGRTPPNLLGEHADLVGHAANLVEGRRGEGLKPGEGRYEAMVKDLQEGDAMVRVGAPGMYNSQFDGPYLQQFLGKPTLAPATERPIISRNANLPTYKTAENFRVESPAFVRRNPSDPFWKDTADQAVRGPRDTGLENYKASLGRDERGPYLSVFDTIDYGPSPLHEHSAVPSLSHRMGQLLDAIGQPFNVYERFALTDEEGRIIGNEPGPPDVGDRHVYIVKRDSPDFKARAARGREKR